MVSCSHWLVFILRCGHGRCLKLENRFELTSCLKLVVKIYLLLSVHKILTTRRVVAEIKMIVLSRHGNSLFSGNTEERVTVPEVEIRTGVFYTK